MHAGNPPITGIQPPLLIKPTVGRVVLIKNRTGSIDAKQPEAALVTYVHSDRCINIAGFNGNGTQFSITSITLLQEGDVAPEWAYAEWMPYQVGQAKKHSA